MNGRKALRRSLAAFSTSEDHQACGWSWTQPKVIEELAAFSAKRVKSAVAEKRARQSGVFLDRMRVILEIDFKVISKRFLKLE